jgi:hypothetical protein
VSRLEYLVPKSSWNDVSVVLESHTGYLLNCSVPAVSKISSTTCRPWFVKADRGVKRHNSHLLLSVCDKNLL